MKKYQILRLQVGFCVSLAASLMVPSMLFGMSEMPIALAEAAPNQGLDTQMPTELQDILEPEVSVDTSMPTVITEAIPLAESSEADKVEEPLEEKAVEVAEDVKDIYLNFDNTELSNFINYIAEIKKLNLIPDKAVEGNKISLTMREPVSVEGAWNVFLTIIEMAGFSIIKVGDVYKIVPKDRKLVQPLPSFINVDPETLPDNDANIRYVMFLTNLRIADVKELLDSMLSDKHQVVDVQDVNGFVITDKTLNIKSAVKVLRELDEMGVVETVTVMRLKNADAQAVKELLDSIIKQPEVSPLARLLGKGGEGSTQFFPSGTKIIAEPRTNALILMGAPKPIKKIEDFIVQHIDTELQHAKSPLHIYELQHTDAQQIAEILAEVTQPGSSEAAAKYGAIRGGVKQFKSMNIKVDKEGNRLIVSSTDKVDWRLLKQTIKDLDKPQPQVAIETLIVTITVDDSKEMGGNTRLKKANTLGQNIGFQSAVSNTSAIDGGPSLASVSVDGTSQPSSLLGNMLSQIILQQGLSVLTFGKGENIWSVFSMLKTQQNATLLSQPFITAANKKEATVSVGSTKRVVVQESSGSGLSGYDNATDGTKLKITPQINIDGVIRMKIDTDITQFEDTEGKNTSTRKLNTHVTIADGQVLVLGGFVKTKVTESKSKTPVLGDLPLLGWFFKHQKRSVNKEYLFIFMCPTIIKPRQLPGVGTYTKMKLHNVTDNIEEAIETKRTPDPIHNWFFNAEKENYSHKVIDFANARYQPTTVNIKEDPYYRSATHTQDKELERREAEDLKRELESTTAPAVELSSLRSEKQPELIQGEAVSHISIDDRKRSSFQQFLTNEPGADASQIVQADVSMGSGHVVSGRDQFKHMLTADNAPNNEALTVDVRKRNRLKEFLSHNPAIAKNNHNVNQEGIA